MSERNRELVRETVSESEREIEIESQRASEPERARKR